MHVYIVCRSFSSILFLSSVFFYIRMVLPFVGYFAMVILLYRFKYTQENVFFTWYFSFDMHYFLWRGFVVRRYRFLTSFSFLNGSKRFLIYFNGIAPRPTKFDYCKNSPPASIYISKCST